MDVENYVNERVGGRGEAAGFVFPSYYGHLSRAVSAFVERLEILPETYTFAVVTMGAVGQGSVSAMIAKHYKSGQEA